MTAGKGKTGVVLPLILIGAVMLSGVGLLGLLLQAAERDDDAGQTEILNGVVNEEISKAHEIAEVRFDESLDEAEKAKENTPSQKDLPISKGFDQPQVPNLPAGEGEITRSSDDDLLSEEGYLNRDSSPEAPDVEISDSLSLLNGKGQLLDDTYNSVKEGDVPSELPYIDINEEVTLPVTEDGVEIDEDRTEDVTGDLEDVSSDIEDLIGENTPETTKAGLNEDSLSGSTWDISNSTVKDEDTDGNPEWKYELRVAYGILNKTFMNGTLEYIIGFEYEYRDADDDGIPEYEKAVHVRMANYSASGVKLAEGLAFSEALRNDTDGNGAIDRVEIRHLSYGYHATILKTVRSYATAGELIMDDPDEDGTFENKEATAVFFYKHETVNPSVTLKESVVMINGKETEDEAELSKLAFNRVNNTSGTTIFEEGYIWSYSEDDDSKNLMIIAARNNTVTGRLQYVILNGTETVTGDSTIQKLTAFAVENSTLLFGGTRSDAVALDYETVISGDQKDETGFLAAARTEERNTRLEESFLLISVDRTEIDNILKEENSTVLAGHNVTTSGLNATMAFANRIYQDTDLDSNPEYLRDSWAVSRQEDHDIDGNLDRESYAVHWIEIRDSDDDGNPEWNQTFSMLGWKVDKDDDGNIDIERGLMRNVTGYDDNSNGFVELKETGTVGFEKTDSDSDGIVDKEKYLGAWEKVTDVNDDGTEINTQTGTWTHEE
jgi:hypothetical protein